MVTGGRRDLLEMFSLFLLPQFLRVFDELLQGVEAILASGHMGVIVQLAESCAESAERQGEMMQCLLHVSLKEGLLVKCKPTALLN